MIINDIPAEALKSEQEDYAVEIKYSPEAIEKKLVKFTTKNGDSFEISSEKLIELITLGVNQEQLNPVFTDTESVDMVYVKRQIVGTATKELKIGDEMRIEYEHAYPVEFAILETAYGIAILDESIPRITLTKEYLDSVKSKIKPEQEKFVKSAYRSFELPLDKDV